MSLSIYEKHPVVDAYRIGGSFTPYAIVAVDKRFTDAELAAEWNRSASVCGIHGDYAEGTRAGIIHRFATLPHFDEADV